MMDIAIQDSTLTITLSGDVDARTAYEPYEAAVAAFDEHALTAVVVDLGTVTFADSTALGMLVRIREHASERGASFRLRDVPDDLRMLLNVTGLDQVLEII